MKRQRIMIFAAIIAVVLLFLWGRSCGIQSVIKNTKIDTLIRRDTVERSYIVRHDSIAYQKVYVSQVKYDTLWGEPEIIIEPTDTAAILKDYYATRFYKDTQILKRGTVIIRDTITENRILGRGLTVTGVDTTITKTIVLKPPRNIVGYWTLSGLGNFKNPFGGAGVGFGLKLPSDKVYQIELKYLDVVDKNRIYGEVTVMFPIRLRPKLLR